MNEPATTSACKAGETCTDPAGDTGYCRYHAIERQALRYATAWTGTDLAAEILAEHATNRPTRTGDTMTTTRTTHITEAEDALEVAWDYAYDHGLTSHEDYASGAGIMLEMRDADGNLIIRIHLEDEDTSTAITITVIATDGTRRYTVEITDGAPYSLITAVLEDAQANAGAGD